MTTTIPTRKTPERSAAERRRSKRLEVDDAVDEDDLARRPHLRRDRHRWRPQRPGQRRLSREGGPQDPDHRASPPRRWRGHHRGAAPGLLVHDVLVRAVAVAAGHHPRPGADQARLHAAADVVDASGPRRERRLPAVHPGPQPEPQGDRAALQARRRRVRPVHPRHRDGLPGHQAAARHGPAGHLQRRPRGADGAGRARLALPQARQAGAPQRRPAPDRQRRGLPRRLLRLGAAQGLPRLIEHHRHEGRAAIAGFGPRAALPLDRGARRRVRVVGLPQEGQRRVHPGAGARGPVLRRRDHPGVAGRRGHHEGRPDDRRRAGGRHRVLRRHRGQRA